MEKPTHLLTITLSLAAVSDPRTILEWKDGGTISLKGPWKPKMARS